MYHLTLLYTQTTFKVSNSSLGIGLIPKEDSDYCKTTNRSFIYYSLFHPALEAGTRPLKSFTVYPNTHIFGLWSRLSTRVGGRGFTQQSFLPASPPRGCAIIGGETKSGGQVQYSRMYYLMILDDYAIKA